MHKHTITYIIQRVVVLKNGKCGGMMFWTATSGLFYMKLNEIFVNVECVVVHNF